MRHNLVEEVVIGGEDRALIPISIGKKNFRGLVDTGASRSCISEKTYNTLKLPETKNFGEVRVTSATGSPIHVMGVVQCIVTVGKSGYLHQFIVCRNINRALILGIDFLKKFRIQTGWTTDGGFKVTSPGNETVEAIRTYHRGPTVRMKHQVTIPPRSLTMVRGTTTLGEKNMSKYYELTPNPHMVNDHPNLVMFPMLHHATVNGEIEVPVCLINLEGSPVKIKDKRIIGLMKEEKVGEERITTETAYESVCEIEDIKQASLFHELNCKGELQQGGFIVSPADVAMREKPKLKDAEVPEEWKEKFQQLFKKYENVFSSSSADIGKTPIVKMEIDTGDNPPISQRPYSLALKHVEWVRQEIETLEKAQIITRSVSPWASPIVIVPKKAAPGEPPKKRMCVDYRALNNLLPAVTKAFSKSKGVLTLVPLPKIDEIYASLQGSVIYSTFDMRSGYYHIELTPASKAKSAFVVGGPHPGKWQFNRCPFGLTQAPAYFQRVVGEVIEGLSFAFGYLDDILVYSSSLEEHLEHCEQIFQRLEKFQLKLSFEKCAFMKKQVQYLGHLISGEGIEPVPEKLNSLKEMAEPTTPKGVKQYLGFVGYYRKFIPKYSDIAKPLTELTKQDVPFEWTERCQAAYSLLKEYLLKEPILKYPDTNRPYVLYTDASKFAWAGVLTQAYEHEFEEKKKVIHHPITYLSGLFKGSQINWATLTKEAYAIYKSVRKLDSYLEGAQTTVRSDHLPLKKFLIRDTANAKVRNWALELEGYRLNFEYIKGIKNTLADAMSRLVKIMPEAQLIPEPKGFEFGELVTDTPMEVNEIDLAKRENKEEKVNKKDEPIPEVEIAWHMTDEEVAKLQRGDPYCQRQLETLQNNKVKKGNKFFMARGLLHRYVTDYAQRFEALVLPLSLSNLVLRLAHDGLGHNGTPRTYALVKRMFYWKGLKASVELYCKNCGVCQKYNIQPVKYTPGQFQVPEAPMDFISMDLIGEFRMGSTQGNRFALTVICMLTGFTWCIPIPDKSAETIVRAYIKNVYSHYGGSRKILSDNGTEFKNKLFSQVAKDLNVEYKVYSPPYHPPSNGRIEGFHSFLKACLSKHVSNELEWDEIVTFVCAVYNFLPNEHSREAPFFLMFGRDPRIPLNEFLRPRLRYLGNDETIISLESLKNIYQIAAHNLKIARTRMHKEKTQQDTKVRTEDLIMIKDTQ